MTSYGKNYYLKIDRSIDHEFIHRFRYEIESSNFKSADWWYNLYYSVHIMMKANGAKPLFHRHGTSIRCVEDIHKIQNTYPEYIRIVDDENKEYSWSEFKALIKDNIGYSNMCGGKKDFYEGMYKDSEGYEFTSVEFR